MPRTLTEHFKRLDKVLIGLWRFRHPGPSGRQWCCTWCYGGKYYDTYPNPTAEGALASVYKNWRAMVGRKRKQLFSAKRKK